MTHELESHPITNGWTQGADFSIDCGGDSFVACGDSGDYAITISTLIENIGGTTMILLEEAGINGEHFVPYVYLGERSDYDNIKKILEWLNHKYNKTDIKAEFFLNSSTYWLNLDWSRNYPGGSKPLRKPEFIRETPGPKWKMQLCNIVPSAPLYFSFYPSSPTTGDLVRFEASLSSSPDSEGSIRAYEWEFGDGTMGNGRYTSHIYDREGNYSIMLTGIDDKDLEQTYSRIIRVHN